MGQARDEAGNIWETDAQGQPVRLLQAAGASPAGQGGMVISDPFKPRAEARADQGAAIAAASNARAERADAREAATAPYDAQRAAAEAEKARIDAEKARRDLAAQQSTATPEQQQGMANLANDEILAAIQRARDGINGGMSTGYWARLPELIQPQAVVDLSGDLNTVSSRITLDTLAKLKQASPTGASGLGSLTEREGALLRDSVAALGQTQSDEKLLDSLANVERHYRNAMALTAGEDYRNPEVAKRYGIAAMPVDGAGEAIGLTKGDSRVEADPALKGVNAHIRGMIGAGKSPAEIVGYMNSVRPGLGDDRAADVTAAVRFRQQNPRVPLSDYAVSVENRQVPMSHTRQMVNAAAQSPFGAYAINAVDALSAGTVDNLQDNPALARAGMRAVSQQNQPASVAGLLSGGALAGGLGEAAVARAGATWAPRVADLLYGGAYGAGSADEGSRLEGAATGVVAGLLGGEAGRRGIAAAGAGLKGVKNEAASYLRERGVPLTVGQILGGASKAREDRLAGFGGVGDQISARRLEGVRGFNQAAFDEGFQPIGARIPAVGEEGVAAARTAVQGPGGAYDRALDGVTLLPDDQFAGDVARALAEGSTLPRVGPEFGAFVDRGIAPHFSAEDGAINGRQVQDVLQQVRGANFGKDSMGGLASDAARGIEGAVMDLADRQVPGAMDALGNANTAYRNLNILSDAVARGINSDGLFTPAQLGMAARSNTTKFGGRIAAATPDRPFYELQRAGQQVLPSKVPDSGTAGRLEANGNWFATGRTALRNTVNAPLYAESTQGIIARALMDRTPGMVAAGEKLSSDRARTIAGLLARPSSLAYGPIAILPEY